MFIFLLVGYSVIVKFFGGGGDSGVGDILFVCRELVGRGEVSGVSSFFFIFITVVFVW